MTSKEWFEKGFDLSKLDRYEDSIKAYEKAIEINPEYAEAWFGKGLDLGELERYEDSIKAYEKAIEINPEYAKAWFEKGFDLGKLERYEDSIKANEKAIEINPEYAKAWYNKGFDLGKLERYEDSIKAYEKAIEINPEYAEAWFGKGFDLGKLERYKDSIKAYEEAIETNPEDALAYSNLGELFFNLGNLKDASQNVKGALDREENLTSALVLKGRIEIEEKDYNSASKYFKKAISSDLGNPLLLLWDAYANYLKVEFSSGPKGKVYQEEIVAVIRELERTDKLSKKEEIREYIMYFLGCFYYKAKDVLAAKEKLEECIRLKSKSPIKLLARELLGNIWDYQIRPPWWRWWLASPLHCWFKRVGFAILLLFIFALLLLHPFIPVWFPSLKINWTLYIFLIAFLIIMIASPSIERIKARDVEVEMRSPPLFEPVPSPSIMEEKIKELDIYPER